MISQMSDMDVLCEEKLHGRHHQTYFTNNNNLTLCPVPFPSKTFMPVRVRRHYDCQCIIELIDDTSDLRSSAVENLTRSSVKHFYRLFEFETFRDPKSASMYNLFKITFSQKYP
jgi:hypothetical protein